MSNKLCELLTKLQSVGVKKIGAFRNPENLVFNDMLRFMYLPENKFNMLLSMDFSDCQTLGDVINKAGQAGVLKVSPRLIKVHGYTVLQLRYNKFLHFTEKSGFQVTAPPIIDTYVNRKDVDSRYLLPDRINFIENEDYAMGRYVAAVIDGANNIDEFFELLKDNLNLFVDFLNITGTELGLFDKKKLFTVPYIIKLFPCSTLSADEESGLTKYAIKDNMTGDVYAMVERDIEHLRVITNYSGICAMEVRLNSEYAKKFCSVMAEADKALFLRAAMCFAGICFRGGNWYSLTHLYKLNVKVDKYFDLADFARRSAHSDYFVKYE